MAKGKNLIGNKGKKIVTKEVGQNVNATYSTESVNSPQTNVVQTPSLGSTQGTIMYWPSPQLFYQQGKDLSKKAYNEYLNASNQYLNVPPDQFDQKMQQAGQMNNLAQSMIQGIAIGVEAAENISKRIRTGDQAALIEMEAVKDTLSKLLKTSWVHNKAAASGRFPGLEAQLLESSLVTRLNQATQLQSTNYGIPVESPEEADTIWVDKEMPAPGFESVVPEEQLSEEIIPPADDESGVVSPSPEETAEFPSPEEESPDAGEAPPPEDTIVPEDEEIPIDINDENQNEEIPMEEEFPNTEIEDNNEEINPETISQDEAIEETQEIPEEVVPEEVVPEESSQEEIDQQISEGESEEVDEDGLPMPTGPNGYYTKEDMLKYGDMIIEQVTEEDESNDNGENNINDEKEEITEEQTPEGNEEEGESQEEEIDGEIYCIGCDKYVSKEDIDACEEPNCPFKVEMADEEEISDEDEVPVDIEEESDSTEEEVPIETEEYPEEEKEEKGIKNDLVEKHFIMVGTEDHESHNVKGITIKEFTGLEGEYCLDCQRIVSYSFDQSCWTSDDAKSWVNKQNKINRQKNISSEEIINKSLDNIPDEVLQQWVEEQSSTDIVVKEANEEDVNFDEFKEVLEGDVFKNILEKAFEPAMARIKNLEA